MVHSPKSRTVQYCTMRYLSAFCVDILPYKQLTVRQRARVSECELVVDRERTERIPQRLKPRWSDDNYGTAEAVL
jgi:hypothetical protein